MISSGTADVPTVRLELPETGYSAPEFQLPAASEDSAPVAGAGLPSEPSPPADIPTSRPTFTTDAPPIEGASPSKWGVKDASMGEPAATPMPSARELPVVARSVDPSLGAEASRPPRSTESVVQPVRESEPATASPELPVVSRSAEPAEESAPLSGFAEAITKLTAAEDVPREPAEAATHDHQAATHDHHAKRDDDHSPHAAQPARIVPVQRHATEDRTPSTEPDLPVVAPAASPAAPSGSLPVVSRIADAGNTATEEIKQPEIETQTETPTLGVRLTQAPLILQRTPVTERVSAPLEPVVQRVEFLPPALAQNLRPNTGSAASHSASSFHADARTGASRTDPGRADDLCRIDDSATFAVSGCQTGVERPGHTPVSRLETRNAGLAGDRRRPAAAAGVTRVCDLHTSGRF